MRRMIKNEYPWVNWGMIRSFQTIYYPVYLVSLLFVSCGQETRQTTLSPKEFASLAQQENDAVILDVRTEEEFREGHIAKSVNIDWNGIDFEKKVAAIDRSKPVLVYCLRGGRSESAAQKMRSMGFTEVYELKGGLAEWQSSDLPVSRE